VMPLESVADANGKIAGLGDFSGDGRTDIVWRNPLTGESTIWFMDGTRRTGVASLEPLADLDWQLAGVADFNADGKDDLVWRNQTSGAARVWLMNGLRMSRSAALGTVADIDARIVAIGDFNRDRRPDIVWRHRVTGENYVWFMKGTVTTGTSFFDSETDAAWTIAGAADYNEDGASDLVWRNRVTGANRIWLLNRTTTTSVAPLPSADVQWRIVPSDDAGSKPATPTPTPTAMPTRSEPSLLVNGSSLPVTVAPGQEVTVTVTGGPAEGTNWIAQHVSTAPNNSHFPDWKYLNGGQTRPAAGQTSATLRFKVPLAPGDYNFRFFRDGADSLLATSPTVRVVEPASPTP